MHELIEGVTGVEVVADDFIAVGYGDMFEEAAQDHDKNLLIFLQRCEERNSPKPREAQAATATSALHWTHGYCSGTENRPRQSSSYC